MLPVLTLFSQVSSLVVWRGLNPRGLSVSDRYSLSTSKISGQKAKS